MAEERILVVQLRQLGDILLTTPCVRAIKRERPKATVTFLSHAMGCLVLDRCPYVDEHFFYAADASWRSEWRLARTLRERRFDLVIDFMNNPRSAFYTRMTGATERIAFQSARRLAYTQTVPRPDGSSYIVRDKFLLLEAAGFSPEDTRLALPWFEMHTQPYLRFLGAYPEFRQAPLKVVLSPTHRRPARRWPLTAYAALADLLTKDWGAAVVWLYGPGEAEDIDQAMALCRERTFKAPPTSFREMAAFVANMDLFIGNSNGPSHVAVATDTPSLQLHGPTSAAAWCPQTERHRAVQAPGGALPELTVAAVLEALNPLRAVAEKQASAGGRPRLSWR